MNKLIFLLICIVLLLTSCISDGNNVSNSSPIKIWYYDYQPNYYNIDKETIKYIQGYANKNNIKVEVISYSKDNLGYEDYLLKRNVAVATGQADIVIDYSMNLYDIMEHSGNYEDLNSYDNIFNGFKGYYCLPIVTNGQADALNNSALEPYGIEAPNIVTLSEYYEIKQKMKESGAIFDFNRSEFRELMDYYLIKNNLTNFYNKKNILDKNTIKNTIQEIYDDLNNNYINFREEETTSLIYGNIVDIRNDKVLRRYMDSKYGDYFTISDYDILMRGIVERQIDGNNDDYSFIFDDMKSAMIIYASPCIFVNKNTQNETINNIVSILFEDDFFKTINSKNDGYNHTTYGPVINTEVIREHMEVDDNWIFNGRERIDLHSNVDNKGVEIYNMYYEMINTQDLSPIFENYQIKKAIAEFIRSQVLSYMRNPEHTKELDKNIDDFIVNTDIYYN